MTIIIVAAASFGVFTVLDDLFVHDEGIRQIYEDVALAIILAVIGVTGSKHFSDSSTDAVLQEVKKMQSDFSQRLENLEFKFKLDNKINE
ncbi:MAG: hypothetical protein ACREAD_06545 [Nitrosopumilaceae archaeon]